MTTLAQQRTLRLVAVLLVAPTLGLALSVSMVGCQRRTAEKPPAPQPTAAPEPTAPATAPAPPAPVPQPPGPEPTPTAQAVPVRIYLVRDEKLGVAGRTLPAGTQGVAAGAIEQLLAAPTAQDRRYRLGSAIPRGTRLLGVSIRSRTAYVDLSRQFTAGGGSLSMQLRVAQVVGTLTQFPTVRNVRFLIEGTPVESIGGEGVMVSPAVTLGDFEDVLPAILVEGPVPGAAVKSPFRLYGSANVFEAQFNMRIMQGATVVTERSVMARSGSGTRGRFSQAIRYPSSARGRATLEVFDVSEKDGSRTDVVRIPVTLN